MIILHINIIMKVSSQRSRCNQAAILLFSYLILFEGESIGIYQKWIPTVLSYMVYPNGALSQVAIKSMGVYCQRNPEACQPILVKVLQILTTIVSHTESRSEQNIRVTENAISAMGQIIEQHANYISAYIHQLLTLWIDQLPVHANQSESVIIYTQFCNFLKKFVLFFSQ